SSTDALIGCDLVTSAAEDILSTLNKQRSRAVVNAYETMPAQFTHQRDFQLHGGDLKVGIEARVKRGGATFIDATRIATALMGDAIAANLFLLGAAYQSGLVPVTAAAIEKAIELNGIAVDMNQRAFLWGRRSVHDLNAVEKIVSPEEALADAPHSLDDTINLRAEFLTAYQNENDAQRYVNMITRLRSAEAEQMSGEESLTDAAARSLFKLMAYKDEYEVARLYTDGTFKTKVAEVFEGDYKLNVHLAPPLLAKRNASGELIKQAYGPWIMNAFKFLAKLKVARGTAFDPFGYTSERKMERQLIKDFERILEEITTNLTPDRHALAVELADLPQKIRGFGHIKQEAVSVYENEKEALLAQFRAGAKQVAKAAE
ncbi:MAG: hypothetical protein K8F25_01885, partial [Fimbriimonadaceae bacterium]|nr:hypothetical protein [Alphaproteobacteria bacterium]